jgi:glutamine phosphoribosylpyrophosphate amidotransferase
MDGVMGIAIMATGAMIANKANAVAAVAGIITADKLNF